MKSKHLVRGAWALAAALPFVALLLVVAKYAYNFPFQDQWVFVPDVDKCFSGTLTLHDLWRQHNEHRIFFPRIVMLILARLTRWNNVAEAWLNVAAGVAIFIAMLALIRQVARATERAMPWSLVFVAACLAFSCNQTENWLWGWQIQIFMNVLAVLLGIALLHMPRFTWPRFTLAIAMGVIASYSFSNGVLFWFAVLPSVLAAPAPNARHRSLRTAIWLAVGAVVIALYLHGYVKPEKHPSLILAPQHPGVYCAYVLCFLGSLCSFFLAEVGSPQANVWGSTVIGAFGIAVFIAALVAHARSKRLGAPAVATCVSLACYALLTAAITGVGRLGFGPAQATTSRYTTIANLFWLACILLVFMLASARDASPKSRRYGAALLVLFLIVQQLGAVYAVRYYAFARQAQALAVDAVRAGCDEPLFVKLVCPTDPQLVPLYRPTLEAKQLSIFGRPLENRNELSDTFCCKGDAHMANRNLDSAEAFYRAALLLNPGNTVPLTGLALVQFDRKDWPAAEQALVHCLQVHPDDSDLHSTLGVTLAQEKKFDDAFAEFAKARQLAPTSPVSYINEAAVRADLSQFSKAIALYQEALRRDPTNAAAQLALGRLLARTGVAN